MQITILKNKVTFSIMYILTIWLSMLYGGNQSIIDNELKSNILLYFSPTKTTKNSLEKQSLLSVLYLGYLYELELSSHFGGQLLLKDSSIQNKYYIVVSDEVEFALDHNGCIKGYKIQPDNIKNAKMYVMHLIITANAKNDMTYNWEIEEIAIPERSLPDNTIIIYSSPDTISFASFNKKFDKAYPNVSQENPSSVIILPPASFDINTLFADSLKNKSAQINTIAGHKKIISSYCN
jgi:hypothetical protein